MAIVSSTEGSRTITGWKRRSSAGSFSTCFRYSSSVVAPTQRSSPRASAGLSMLAASTAPSAAPAPTSVCSSSMKQMISPVALRDLAEHGLEAVLELAAVLGARHHRADVERDEPLALEALGHVAGDDALGQAFHDGRLADAGLADQHRVVLGAARQHLDHAADLLVAADHGVELALARQIGQVLGITLERLVLLLGVDVRHALRAAHLDERLVDGLGGDAARGEHPAGGPRLVLGDGDQQVLGRDVLVLEPLGLVPRAVDDALEARRGVLPAAPALDLGQLVELGLDLARDALGPRAELGAAAAPRCPPAAGAAPAARAPARCAW